MGENMTHDELSQFAAEKVGGEVVSQDFIHDQDRTKNYKEWYVKVHEGLGIRLYPLTSFDLMGKGMAVFHKERHDGGKTHIIVQRDGSLEYNLYISEMRYYDLKNIEDTNGIPLAFWECWYRLEKGEIQHGH